MKNFAVLNIRNVPENVWVETNERLFHAIFTIMCEHIENEYKEDTHNNTLEKYVEWCKEELEAYRIKKDESEIAQCDFTMFERQANDAFEMKRLYDWYNSVDWSTAYIPDEELEEYMNAAIKNSGFWWT